MGAGCSSVEYRKYSSLLVKKHQRTSVGDKINEAAAAKIEDKPKTQDDFKMIMNALANHFILKSLDEDSRLEIAREMKHYTIGPRECIFEEGKPGSSFYILASGRLEVVINGVKKNVIFPGFGFGELALLDDRPRTASIITIERCTLWGVDRETFKEAVRRVNIQGHEENKAFIDNISLFKSLTQSQKSRILASLNTQRWGNGQKIIKEGDVGTLFYIIKDGIVVCSKNDMDVRHLGRGEYFGELSELYDQSRSATVTAIGDVKVVSISCQNLFEILEDSLQQIIYKNSQRIAIENSYALSALKTGQIDKLLDYMETTKYYPGEVIIPKGTMKGLKLWIVLKGLAATASGWKYGNLTCIGDKELLMTPGSEFSDDIVAEIETDISEISKETIENCIGGNLREITTTNDLQEILQNVYLFAGLDFSKHKELKNSLNTVFFNDKDLIAVEGHPGEYLYIIKSGKAICRKENKIVRTITKHDYFGERALIFDSPRSASIEADGPLICWTIIKSDFLSLINDEIRSRIYHRIEMQDISISLSDLTYIKPLGKSMFGNVFLMAHQNKSRLYTVKAILKEKIENLGIQVNLKAEREIGLQVNHWMMMNILKTFKDDKRVYIMTEFIKGKDLFMVLREIQIVNELHARYLSASIVLMLEYLHEREIVYRDLKPENIIIDEEGYPILIDFGTAKIVKGRTYTRLGSPHYMAPEIILGAGYSFNADWWSLGIILYELLYGKVPFGEDETDTHAICEKIIEHRISYSHSALKTHSAKPIIQQLLNNNPAARTGGGIKALKSHRWFENLNWDRLRIKALKMPYIPKFRDWDNEIEEALMDPKIMYECFELEESNDPYKLKLYDREPSLHIGWDNDF
ncbi:unnamed protein product [Blepharisma stoltei]|uniref:cGMP-dependent protein kinase n=1 Tax=Blepharisma stoltei TaxID=1481888 RepID=A0AAU9IGR8_9CILI|nr:unnamed protein product [Blepharisma stoltei]